MRLETGSPVTSLLAALDSRLTTGIPERDLLSKEIMEKKNFKVMEI